MILWLASYPRSGNSFLRVVLKVAFGFSSDSLYVEGRDPKARARRRYDENEENPYAVIDRIRQGLVSGRSLADMALATELCPVKTHDLPGDDEHPAIYIVRDGRDALVSYAHYALEQGTFGEGGPDSFASMLRALVGSDGYFGGWGRHVVAWTSRRAPTEVVRFEELIADPVLVVERALSGLGIPAERTGETPPSFAELRKASPTFFRTGLVGSYKEEMPPALEDLFWTRHGGAMRRLGCSLPKRRGDGPLVTIVTPSYNQGRFIRDTIESVLNQDYPHIEYLVVDGGSTDETAGIAAEYADRLIWISERDRGQSDAINKGFRMARGEIVCWLNSDDLLLPRAVSTAVEAFQCDPDLGVVYGDGYLIDDAGNLLAEFPKAGRPNLWKLIYFSDYILQPAAFLRRRALEQVGYLDEDLHWGMDWDLLIRLGKRSAMKYVPEFLASQRQYDDTKTASGGLARFRELVGIMRRHGKSRYPPAYICYGADTWINLARRRSPAALLPVILWAGQAALPLWKWFIEKMIVKWEGWYADDWVTTKVHLLLRKSGDRILIRGSLPQISEHLRDQRLKVFCNGLFVSEFPVPFGDFEHLVPLTTPVASELLEVSIEAARSFVPCEEGINDDPRVLAYLLREVA